LCRNFPLFEERTKKNQQFSFWEWRQSAPAEAGTPNRENGASQSLESRLQAVGNGKRERLKKNMERRPFLGYG